MTALQTMRKKRRMQSRLRVARIGDNCFIVGILGRIRLHCTRRVVHCPRANFHFGGRMSDRKRPKTRASAGRTTSRREVLRIGAALIPAGVILPAWLTATAAATSTSFDFYMSTTGSDSNPGTLSQPWAITSLMNTSQNAYNVANWSKLSGKRIGLLPGTYNIGTYMQPSSWKGAVQLPGGSSGASTYLGSSDSSGNYSRGTATLNALNGGVYGGTAGYSFNGPILSSVSGVYQNAYLTIDGVQFTGFSYKGVRIGGASSQDGPGNLANVIVQNCTFYNGSNNPNEGSDNRCGLWLDGCAGALVQNNYFHDITAGTDSEHNCSVIAFTCQQCTFQYNTMVNAGCFYGKIGGNQGNVIQYNYIDSSAQSLGRPPAWGMLDWCGDLGTEGTVRVTQPTYFRNNIVVSPGQGFALFNTSSYAYGWVCPVFCYNNTIVLNHSPYPAIWIVSEQAYVTRGITCYNNIYTGAADSSGYQCFVTNPTGPAVWDYNMYLPSGMSWALRQDSALASVLGTYTSAAAFGAAIAANGGISGAESHSISAAPTFANTGTLAQLYQLASGSAGKGAGRVGGVPSGAACDMGAWGNGATQIGCSFTSTSTPAAPVPMAPALSVS